MHLEGMLQVVFFSLLCFADVSAQINETTWAYSAESSTGDQDTTPQQEIRLVNGTRRSVRLVNGSTASEGRLEVLVDGRWGTVCDDGFGSREAGVACRMLGYSNRVPLVRSNAFYGEGSADIVMDDVYCVGNETDLTQCSFDGYLNHNCGHHEDVGIDCQFVAEVSSLRLVNGSRSSRGRLEVQVNGRWGTVCDDLFDVNAAKVACRMLGYASSQPMVMSSVYFGQGSGNILFDNVICTGNETNLGHCDFLTIHDCTHEEDVGVDCLSEVSRVRLVNGSRPSEGRLEVLLNGYWGTVCDDSFGLSDAIVVCRMLGYSGMQPLVRDGSFYGQGFGEILMDDVGCIGSETSMEQCSFIRNHNCGHHEDVGVDCRPIVSSVRLANGSRVTQGRLEVLIGGRWGTVCDDGFGTEEARVACRMLGYTSATPIVRSSAFYGPGIGDILMDDLLCVGNETNLAFCSFRGTSDHNCGHYEDVGIDCQPPAAVSSVRLMGGRSSSQGRLEVLQNGRWGTVCDDSFGINNARVVCRMLRFTGYTPVVRSSAFYGEGSGNILMDEVNCDGSESNLGHCSYRRVHDCSHSEDVGIDCRPYVSRVRLVSTNHMASQGRLEVLIGGVWGSVCDDSFGVNDAKVACRMLGYSGVVPVVRGDAYYGQGSGDIHMDDVQCTGTESNLADCDFLGQHNCGHHEDVGIDCVAPPIVSSVRLTNGSRASEGRLEVLSRGQWGTVCDDQFDVADASVVCRMLGYPGYTPTVMTRAYYGEGTGNILLDDVSCMGSEASLGQCMFTSEHNCRHFEDVGIQCRPTVTRVRLAGGYRQWEGRLEVMIGGRWGTVCDDYFEIKDAKVACRMLGYYSSVPDVRIQAYYGQGSGVVLMDDVKCVGTESNLGDCSFVGSAAEDCSHSEDIGLDCQPTVSEIRLVNGSRLSQGRLEVNINGQWGTVCDDHFTVEDAQVACRMLGYTGGTPVVTSSTAYGPGTGSILMDDVNCSGSETHLGQCSFRDLNNHNCLHSEDVGIICPTVVSRVRLANGNSRSQGRLEVLIGGQWGTVCDDSFDVRDARVVCRMLGYTGTSPTVKGSAFYGPGSGDILMDNVDCRGNELSLDQCSFVNELQHDCTHSEDVGVIC